MCGRYSLKHSTYNFPGILENNEPGRGFGMAPSDDIAPGLFVPVITESVEPSRRGAEIFLFGRTTERQPRPLLNARAETVHEKRTFAKAFRERRCIVPADGWYEWVDVEGAPAKPADRLKAGLTRAGKQKLYYSFPSDTDSLGEMFYFAGIFGQAQHKTKEGWKTTTAVIIITAAANPQIEQSGHHRQPVIMPRDDIDAWLDPGNSDPEFLRQLLVSRDYQGLHINAC